MAWLHLHATSPDACRLAASASAGLAVVQVSADVGITKAVTPASVQTGGSVNYTLTLVSRGPNAMSSPVVFTDTLPAGLTLLGAVASGAGTPPGGWWLDLSLRSVACALPPRTHCSDTHTHACASLLPTPPATCTTVGGTASGTTLDCTVNSTMAVGTTW
jgi:uncharacterized repeat protein (TIGR01451 family)